MYKYKLSKRGVFYWKEVGLGEEKIRRAEEIYNRRRATNQYNRNVTTLQINEKRNYRLFKKMILQILICLVIYFIFYLIQNNDYIFSEDVINKTKEWLSYDINLEELWNKITNQINAFLEENQIDSNQNEILQNTVDENTINENNINENIIEGDAIGGAEHEEIALVEPNIQEEKENEIPQTDEEYIKCNFSIIKPVEGIVSSEFGQRESTSSIVSKNHSGIDIAANIGTAVIAAIDGKVTVSSTIGDYGQHIKIENNDVATLYAHCSKLLVKVGDEVKQGDKIAEVGSTGRSTGPHLHFEIIRGSNYINPRNIVEF